MEQTIREQLNELADEKYRVFSSALTPGKENILGVRLPLLQKMAAKIAKGDWKVYLTQASNDT
ncbi:DNA alkylation repair protein, partial [Armatimonadetes bacterium]|nr:DNA alkylation repair protein [bacterium]